MSTLSSIITEKNSRAIWKKLRNSIVPIVDNDQYNSINIFFKEINRKLSNNSYIPDIGHGYLGYPKSNGCTRFVPILTKEDITVYYILFLSLQDALVKDIPGVYGAWQTVPKNAVKNEQIDAEEQSDAEVKDDVTDPYYSDTFSKKAWFKNWNQYNELLAATCDDKDIGNYVLVSDIANFYDTIDNVRLINSIRSNVSGSEEVVALLSYFLQNWDRRIKGYVPSPKGIPQEIISDASRMLANFYLRQFDEDFRAICDTESVVYIRWADDLVLFGGSPAKLEKIMHRASRLLLQIGLNLNASKTKHFTRNGFKRHRGLDVLETVKNKDAKSFDKQLKKFAGYCDAEGARVDTVLKASLNMLSSVQQARTIFTKNFINERIEKYQYISILNEGQLMKRYDIFGDVKRNIAIDLKLILSKPYASPRASYISFLKKKKGDLVSMGISEKFLKGCLQQIYNKNGESEIIREICIPSAYK